MQVRWTNLVMLSALPACPAAVAPFVASWHWTLDLLACFPVQAGAWLLLCGSVLLAARQPRRGLALLAAAALAASSCVPAWWRSPPAGDPQGPTVRVLSLNLLRGNEASLARALAVVAQHDPDVLFCSEVTPGWLAGLDRALPHLPHRCVQADAGYFGVALFSRWPLRDAAVLPLGFHWAPAVRAVVTTPGGALGVLGVHTPRPGDGRRCAERDAALAALPAVLAPLPPLRVVMGDCNATPWNHAFVAMLATTGLRQASDGGHWPTWSSTLPWPLRVPIDHVLVGDGLGVAAFGVGEDFGSDHLPVAATVRLPRPQ